MRVTPLFLALILSFALHLTVSRAEAQGAADQGNSGSGFKAMDTSMAMRRAYPGGRDDSDLTVQPKKRITKKETDFERYDVESEPEPDTSSGDEGFGE